MTRARLTTLVLATALGILSTLTPLAAAAPVVPVSTNVGCDPLDPAVCMFPFPNDYFTVPDVTTATGRRVSFHPLAMPRGGLEITEGGEGKPIDPTEWNRNDGFSPGSPVLTYVPGIDLHRTWGTATRPHGSAGPNEPGYFDHRDHIADIALYARPDAPIVILNAKTGARHPFWSELDSHPGAVESGERALILRPAVNFQEGARYIVALRNLRRADGSVIPARPEFAAYRSGRGADPARQRHFDREVFPVLQRARISRHDLYLAWDFTVASERNLSERFLHMRDDAFRRYLGDEDLADRRIDGRAPSFVIDSTESRTDTWTDSRGVSHSQAMRRVHGRITVPNYMDRIQQTEGHLKKNDAPYDLPVPGSRLLDLNSDGLPDQNPVEPFVNVPFVCDVPLDGPRFPMLYGHGLLGTRSQIGDLKSPRRDGPFMGCGLDWWGMSTPDVPTIAAIIADLSGFASLPDRAQQGFLNFLFAGRALVHPQGFASHPAFQKDDGSPLIRTSERGPTKLYYDGNSQGGIMGGALVAVSPDIHRGILGVPGMNYSTLLQRSVDFEDLYAIPYYEVYRDPMERQLTFALIQMLWDRGEANGYAAHMTHDPLRNTPKHEVMLQLAYADHQVANVAAEVEGRTIDAPIMLPGLAGGRHWEMRPYFSETATYPYQGSAVVYWDSGNVLPPNGNVPPDDNPRAPAGNRDPHGDPRNEPAASWQEAQFLLTGWMVDVCGGGPYLTRRHPSLGGTSVCHPPAWEPGSREY